MKKTNGWVMMSVSAYIFLNVEIGSVRDVMNALTKIEECRSVAVVSGVYDILVRVDIESLEALHDLTVEGIHKIPGITKTITQVIEKEIRT
ncbi:MAG: Lrp/AsnC family transcriptional regulator [Candidatus Hodarchaeales archaeon]|jgi:DNA-binding Lrp family transcriptional regulator